MKRLEQKPLICDWGTIGCALSTVTDLVIKIKDGAHGRFDNFMVDDNTIK
ncbi:MAG: hypothetical protein ACP5D6_09580 [Kosmotogaceae bacterium]